MIDSIRKIATEAGEAILKHFHAEVPADIDYKADDSPLTMGDRASHEAICKGLAELTPDIPVLSEESESIPYDERRQWKKFWLVDPLDGTKEFIKRTGDFTVNIALIENGEPILGVVHAPVLGVTYFAEKGTGAFKATSRGESRISVRSSNADALCIVASKDHAGPQVAAMLEKLPGAELTSMGSSLKFCLVAEGVADLYPRFVPTMEWDTGAAQCVVEAAGGSVMTLDGGRLIYQKEVLRNPSVITVGDPDLDWKNLLPSETP